MTTDLLLDRTVNDLRRDCDWQDDKVKKVRYEEEMRAA